MRTFFTTTILYSLVLVGICIRNDNQRKRVRRLNSLSNCIPIESAPYHVQIEAYGVFRCSGVLISHTHVLTAAHCVYDIVQQLKSDISNYLLINPQIGYAASGAGLGFRRRIKRIAYDKLYRECKLFGCEFHTDFAIITLSSGMRSPRIHPIDIIPNFEMLTKNAGLEINGYGHESSDHFAFCLRQSMFKVIDLGECHLMLNTVIDEDDTANICLSPDGPGKLTKGDDGAPVIARVGSRKYLVGIVSMPTLSGNDNISMIMNVTHFLKMIDHEQDSRSRLYQKPLTESVDLGYNGQF